MSNIRFEDDKRTVISDTFRLTIPTREMSATYYWEDGAEWGERYPHLKKEIVLCSSDGDPLVCLSKTATQKEAEVFLKEYL